MLTPFSSVVIYGLLGTCSFLKTVCALCVLKDFVFFMVTLVSVPESVIKHFFKMVFERCVSVKISDLSKYLSNVYLLEKGCSFPPFL